MKKIIALALALIMVLSMGVVALADTCIVEGVDDYDVHWVPGMTDKVDNFAKTGVAPTDKDWKVTADWTKGGALVAGIYWDKDEGTNGAWMLELKENYTITTLKDLEGKITFTAKGANKAAKLDDVVVTLDWVVSNHLVEVYGEEDADDCIPYEAEDNTLYICAEDEAGYVKFNTNALLGATLNMASEEKAFMYNDESAIEALEEKYPDAEIECYNFGGSPVFKNAAKFTLQADYADQYYVYTYTKGKLEAQSYDWNSIEGVYEWTTKAPTSYVISDVELVAAAEETKNPDTGANDVVGVAAALAVVSLVAAGAVSLKK